MNDDEVKEVVSADSAEVVEQPDEQQQPEERQAEPEKTPVIDYAKIQESVAEGLRQGQPKTQEQLSPEEFRKRMNAVTVDADMLKALYGFEEVSDAQVKAHQQFVESVVRNAVTMADWRVKAAELQMQDMISPLRVAAQQQQEHALRQEFMQTYPQLKNFDKLLDVVYQQASADVSNGAIPPFKTKKEAFAHVANRATEMIKGLGLSVGTKQNNNQQQSQMSAVSAGGQGGGAGGGAAGQTGGVSSEIRSILEG